MTKANMQRQDTRYVALLLALAIPMLLVPRVSAAEYTASGATKFVFTDRVITVTEGNYTGYKIEGTELTINGAGTYIVSGSCSDGSIKVKKGTTGVTLVLNGLTLTSAATAPIACNKSTEVNLVAASGTSNTLTDSAKNNDDNYPDNDFLFFIQKWRAWFFSKLLILRSIPEPVIFQTGFLGAVIKAICRFVHHAMVFLRIDKKALYRKCKSICTMYNNTETKRFGYPCDTDANTNMLYKRRTFPCRKWKFEDVELNFPRDMKGMLRNFFGDTYMQLPPVEKRKTHFPYILDFGDGEE